MIYAETNPRWPETCQEITDKMSAIWPEQHDFPIWHKLCLKKWQKTIINFKTK